MQCFSDNIHSPACALAVTSEQLDNGEPNNASTLLAPYCTPGAERAPDQNPLGRTIITGNFGPGGPKIAAGYRSPDRLTKITVMGGVASTISAQRRMATCTVCFEAPTEPRALSCNHSFCTDCLRGMLDKVLFGGPLVCPNCRAETDVPPEGVDGFPLDYATQKSEELPSFNAQAEIEAPCKNCEDRYTANIEPAAYCYECEGGICESCVRDHRRMKIFKNHNFTPWDKVCQDTFKPKRSHRHCGIHPGMENQLFCEQCNQFICSLCLKERHKAHIDSAKPLKEVSKDKAEKVSQLQEKAEKKLTKCEQRLEELKEMEEGLADYPGNLTKSIIDTFKEYMGHLNLWQQQQLTEAQERCNEIAKSITAQQIDATNTMEHLRVGIQLAKEAVSCTTDGDIIERSSTAINQLESTVEPCDESPLRPLVFEKGNLHFGKLRCIEPGDIKVEVPNYCFMHEENPVQVSFTLPVNTLPSLKIWYGSQKQRSVRVPPPAPADTKLGFVPRCAGKHSIEVYIGGVMCKRCDDVMVVRGAPKQESRVKPGPDWKDEENIGVTSGTVLDVQFAEHNACIAQQDDEQKSFEVTVQWDNGNVVKYNWGDSDEYQLELDE